MWTDKRKRRAFTLVEMLVALAIILLLAAITVALLNFREKKLATDGANMLQGWLLNAQQWALRDQAPRGVRLGSSLNSVTLINQFVYIEQPDDFTGGYVQYSSTGVGGFGLVKGFAAYNSTGAPEDFSGGFYAYDSSTWPVQVGDWTQISNGGTNADHVFRIEKVTDSTGASSGTLPMNTLVVTPVPPDAQFTNDYRIVRAPRPRRGEQPVQLPDNIVVDLLTNSWYGNPLPRNPWTGTYDILFGPSGSVIGLGSGNDKIQLWVRDLREDTPATGGTGAAATATVSGGVVTAVNVTSGGTGYNYAPFVRFTGGGGYGADATATVSGGSVTSITINNGGTGYTQAPQVSLVPGLFSGDQALVTVYVHGGTVRVSRVDTTVNPPNNTRYLNPYSFTQTSLTTPP